MCVILLYNDVLVLSLMIHILSYGSFNSRSRLEFLGNTHVTVSIIINLFAFQLKIYATMTRLNDKRI